MGEINQNPTITIVIALKNEMGYIEKCLESLLDQTYDKDKYEILVFDGHSVDGTKEYLLEMARRYPQIRVYDNPREVAAAGWNMGFKMSRAKYVVMMGGHTYVDPRFIEKNVEILERENVPCSGGSVKALGEDVKSQAIAFAFNHPFGVGDARYRYARHKCYVETVNYGMYRRSVVEAIGPINEEIKRGEDWEYNYRIVKTFGKMVYSPDIKSFYYSRANFKQLWKRQYDAGKYKPDIIRKYPGSILFRHIIPLGFALGVILLPLLILAGLNPLYLVLFWLLYFSINLSVSLSIALRHGMQYFFYLIWVFFVMQFAYGLGFLMGLLHAFKNIFHMKRQ